MSEVLFTALLCSIILALILFNVQKNCRFLWLAGLLLGLAALCRSFIMYFVPFIILWWFLFHTRRLTNIAKYTSILLISMLLMIIPWTIRNYFIQHQFVFIDIYPSLNLYVGSDKEHLAKKQSGPFYIDFMSLGDGRVDEVELGRRNQRAAIQNIIENLPQFLERSIWKTTALFGLEDRVLARFLLGFYGSVGIPQLWLVLTLMWGSFIIVSLLGWAGLIFSPPREIKILFLFLIGFFILLHIFGFAQPRYHYPLMPIFFIYAGWVINKLRKILCDRDKLPSSVRTGFLFRLGIFIIVTIFFLLVWYTQITSIGIHYQYVAISENQATRPFYQQLSHKALAAKLWPRFYELLSPH